MDKKQLKSKHLAINQPEKLHRLADDILKQAAQLGANAAEVVAHMQVGLSASVRMGEVDKVEFEREKSIAVTLYCGQRRGSASTSDSSAEAVQATVAAAWQIAQVTEEDQWAGLADKELMATDYPDLQLFHPWDLTAEEAITIAKQCESLGRAVDSQITNSEGASISTSQNYDVYANSHGFLGAYPSSTHDLSCLLIAEQNGDMQRDYYYTCARDPQDLEAVERVAEEAARKTLARLGTRTLSTRKTPVIFSAEVARSLFGCFLAAISGGNLYRRTSFLCDQLGKIIFPEFVTIQEQAHRIKGYGSAPFDAEGVRTQDSDIIAQGVLQRYVLGSYSARRLGMQTTGNAGGVYNLHVNHQDVSLPELLRQMNKGLLVTELIGHGVNIVTGDYSLGAAGFWVEGGEIQYPVSEITVAGQLPTMFKQIIGIANDVDQRGNIQTGSVLIESMIVAGQG